MNDLFFFVWFVDVKTWAHLESGNLEAPGACGAVQLSCRTAESSQPLSPPLRSQRPSAGRRKQPGQADRHPYTEASHGYGLSLLMECTLTLRRESFLSFF